MQLDSLIGRQIDGFQIQERIGRGGMATVYRAYQPSVNRYVALKMITLDSNIGEKDEFSRRFEQEAKVVASLEHIHILPIYDYGLVNNEMAYLAMRLLRGGSLAALLVGSELELNRAADIFTQVAHGLAYAHANGVIHRDLKPGNILLDETGNAFLTDFGLAKLTEQSIDLTKTGHIVGTPTYMAPEQLRGDHLTHRSDIYSMGVILYHMLVGHPPFNASDSNMVSIIYQHLERPPTPPREVNPNIPPEVENVVLRALSKDPNDRYATATAMADDLNRALGRKVSTTSMTASPAARTTTQIRARRRVPLWLPVIGAVGVIATLGAAALMFQTNRAAPFTPAIVLDGETSEAADIVPGAEEIARAQANLGSDGFIAHVTCNSTSEYHAAQAREIRALADGYGLGYRLYDGESSDYTQILAINRALTEDARAIILCPLNVNLLAETLAEVEEAGIPLVLQNSDMENYGGILIAGDDYLMGLEAGRAAGRIAGEALDAPIRAVILDYPDLPTIITRANGMQDGLIEVARRAQVIGRYLGATPDNARASIEQLIEDGVDFNVILSINDAGAYGAIEALRAADIDPASVIISSVDAEALARQYIDRGEYIRASVNIGRENFSIATMDAMVKLLAGDVTLAETVLVPPEGAVTSGE